MEPWGTPGLTGYSYEGFTSRTTQSCLLLRKEEIRPNMTPNSRRLKFVWRRLNCQTLSKASDISSATAWVAPDLLKTLTILSDTTIQRSAVDREDLKPYWESEERPHFLTWSTILLFTCFVSLLSAISKVFEKKKF